MNIRQIVEGVHYVGVNDRTTTRFEALWPLPLGVSYNSYIVDGGEKVALIDGVAGGEVEAFFERIADIIGDREIDYLVVNHMEPDHSGAIPMLADRYPNMKIIGNRQTLCMIVGFYHISESERILEVKDGETISLGNLSLKFVLTPMVHWPETMMTYIAERELIFAGDAFGCFGALDGGVCDTEMDTDRYFPEMYRYYSNIVGKYGRFVQRAISKVAPLKLSWICSTHGPVWHERIAEVADVYNRLSSGISEDGVTIVYGSMYGNTADVADRIASALAARGVRRIRVHNASFSEMSFIISDAFRYKGLIVGSPTYSMTVLPPVQTFMNAMQTREVKNKTVGVFGSFTWASAAAQSLAKQASEMGMEPVAMLDMKQSPDKATLDEIERFADAFVAAMKSEAK